MNDGEKRSSLNVSAMPTIMAVSLETYIFPLVLRFAGHHCYPYYQSVI
ncbi:hypothetical protein KCP74_06985 [Salmonella enterica subsp. enterica]|nr:hypothetical protein KCP74_06985 [Salmonella enterica subsp. enterica]